jgi:hypothetical protein
MKIDRRSLLTTSAAGIGLLGIGGSGLLVNKALSQQTVTVPRRADFPILPIGMNLAGIADWEPGFPFRNLFWGARPWLTRNSDGSGPHDTKDQAAFEYDQDGYPLQVPVAVPGKAPSQTVFTYLPNCRKAGNYVLLYDGDGDFEALASTRIISATPGRVRLRMAHVPGNYEAICIKRSKRGNHVRNIRLVAEADENVDLNQSPFLPEFLNFCRPFHCLRFMDWASTNNSTEEHWANRKRPTFYTMVAVSGDPEATYGPAPTPFQLKFSGGVAIEWMIKLCNELRINPWFCIPHRATDDYMAQFARLVRSQLDPKLSVYLEYSNEIWNWQFHQAGWMLRSPLAGALVEAKGGFPWKNADRTDGKDHPERIGALFRRAFAIWEREWSGTDQKRLIRVAAVQAAWVDASIRTIDWCLKNGGLDAVSPAAYIGPDDAVYAKWAQQGANLTPEQVIGDLQAQLTSDRQKYAGAQIIAFGKKYGLKYVAYEGGQHIQPKGQQDQPYSPALAAAQLHPAMYDLYTELFRFHRDLGCEMFGHYSSIGRQGTRWGSWGAKSSYGEANLVNPKMRAIMACNQTRRSSVTVRTKAGARQDSQ